jgi:hypothetical protein
MTPNQEMRAKAIELGIRFATVALAAVIATKGGKHEEHYTVPELQDLVRETAAGYLAEIDGGLQQKPRRKAK